MQALQYLLENQTAFISTVAIISLMVGSFLNVVIHRLPIMMENSWRAELESFTSGDEPTQNEANRITQQTETFNLSTPRSRCPHCGHAITAIENIPLISYLALRGKCRGCQARISPRYPLVELTTAMLSTIVAWKFFGDPAAALTAVALTWVLIALTGIDYDTYLLPDNLTLPLLWAGLIANYFEIFTTLESALWGAVAGYLSLWSVYWLFKLLTGKEGMGYGDFKLLAALGAWMGWQMLPVIILLSSLVGAVVGIAMILFSGHDKSRPIPFGPYLAAAGWIALLWGNTITRAYLDTMGIA
ncbi:MAG: A24 family peptidase [Gammaproteobacteria bacterium]|nr:A24 family peptidase [Gammaproteobacteria bacterium]